MSTTKGGDVESSSLKESYYGVSFEQLSKANEDKDNELMLKLGGLEGLARALHTDLCNGLDTKKQDGGSLEDRSAVFGSNKYKETPPKSFFSLVWDVLQDPIVILLCIAAGISTTIGAAIPEEREANHWIEGVAIWIAVLIVTMVGAGNDYSKDIQFRKLNAKKDDIEVKVVRNGVNELISNTQVVVGDVLILDTGDKVCADGLTVKSFGLTIDEASLTGESDPMKKGVFGSGSDDSWVRSGTQVTEGSGAILVLAVGEQSEWGKTLALVSNAGSEDTPLQEKLETLAGAIGKAGMIVAVVCFIAQLIKWCVDNKGFPIKRINDNGPIQFLLYSITIVVVAVPEGLPLAVTISLAYSMKKMMKDNNFVRVLAACETMGGATAICSDKTGTLTENRMTVVEGWFAGKEYRGGVASPDELPDSVVQKIAINCAMNSKAFLVPAEKRKAAAAAKAEAEAALKGAKTKKNENKSKSTNCWFWGKGNGKKDASSSEAAANGGEGVEFVGNRTECALLLMLEREWRHSALVGGYEKVRRQQEPHLVQLYGFSSTKKMASVLLRDSSDPTRRLTLYNKGAAEWVIQRCSHYIDAFSVPPSPSPSSSSAAPSSSPSEPQRFAMTPEKREELLRFVTGLAKRGLRCICLTYKDIPAVDPTRPANFFEDSDNLDQDLTVLAIVGIKDPVRKEVPDAVRTCKRAGIVVRMVTGDNIFTARHIARECGILDDDTDVTIGDKDAKMSHQQQQQQQQQQQELLAMEGPTFRNTPVDQIIPLLPRLRVLARSSPEDKLTLVRLLKQQGEVVAVTGDGTNDAPALKESDVGLAMGIAGTEVAKEAADIVIMDDNFSSIVKSVLWGRSVFANIRKFLQFQLTVNFVALVTAFIGAVVGGHEPLNVLQLLWVNLIMDTMGALALATEDPTPALLKQKPNGRTQRLINRKMVKHILVQGFYQLIWMFLCLYGLPTGKIAYDRYKVHGKSYFYENECEDKAKDAVSWFKHNGELSGSEFLNPAVWAAYTATGSGFTTTTQLACRAVGHCGFPYGSADAASCPLDVFRTAPLIASYNATASTATNENYWSLYSIFCNVLPANASTASSACQTFVQRVDSLRSSLGERPYTTFQDESYRRPLSVLFNIFIFCQVANEINSRRINDELNPFEGLWGNGIFLAVIAITIGLQAIIINFLGMFFKVEALEWDEWLVSIAVGFGAWPLSFLTRVISRKMAKGGVVGQGEEGEEREEEEDRKS